MSKAKNESLTRLANAAARKAAAVVVRRAKQAGTPVIVWEDGGVKAIPPEVMEARLKGKRRKRRRR